MANNPDGSDDTAPEEMALPNSQQLTRQSDIGALMLSLQQRVSEGQLQVSSNTFQIAAVSSRPGTLDPRTLNHYLNEAKNIFIPTKTFEDIHHLLEKNCHVTISGASGEGKTTMALMLGQKYRKKGYELVFIKRPEVFELESVITSGQKFFFIFDDIFGSDARSTNVTVVKRLCEELKLHIDNNLQAKRINKAEKKTQGPNKVGKQGKKHLHKITDSMEIRVIFTSKTYNFKDGISRMQYERICMFSKSIVDLTIRSKSPYTHQEKREMFEKHHEMNPERDLGDLKVDHCVRQDTSLFGFPLTCKLFFECFGKGNEDKKEQTKKEKAKAIDFFKRPIYYLRIELNNILSRRNEQAAAFLIVMMSEGHLKLPELESKHRNEEVHEMVKHVADLTNTDSGSCIAEAAKNFKGTYLSKGDNLCFAHSSIYEACACALYNFYPRFVLQYCSLDFLYGRLRQSLSNESTVSDQLHYIFVAKSHFPVVISRFVKSMKRGIFSRTVAHPIMQDKSFVKKFLEEIKQDSDNMDWIQLKENGKGFLYWIVKSEGIYLVKDIEKALQIQFSNTDIREALLASVECDSLTIFKILMDKLEAELGRSDMNKHLLASARSSGSKMVKYLLDMGANVFSTDESDRTFLHLLFLYDRPKIIELVTKHTTKEDINLALVTLDEDGRTPLMLAALHGNWDCFKLCKKLVKASAQIREGLIHLACKGGNKKIVELLLTNTNLNKKDQNGWTPIMTAAYEGKSDVFDLLFLKRPDVTLVDAKKNTMLHLACSGGSKHIVNKVLPYLNLNSKGQYGWTPVMVAAYEGKSDIFHLLCSKGADLSLVDEYQHSLLHFACQGDKKDIVESVLSTRDVNKKDHYKRTPIMIAALKANSNVFDLLWSHEANLELTDDQNNALIHFACAGGNMDIVEKVLETLDNINARGLHSYTPVMVAALAAKFDVFDLLVSRGADVTLVDEDGNTLLHLACMDGKKHIVERVLTHQNINSRGLFGWTPIMVAAVEANSDAFDLLLSEKPDVTFVDEELNTLLHLACLGGNRHIVENVLKPENIDTRCRNGWTPIMSAAQEGHIKIVEYLCEKGADLTCCTSRGSNVITVAESAGKKDVVSFLANISKSHQSSR